jgi:hypothetical protein
MPGRNGGTLRRFAKGETGNPYGRPKKLVSQTIADLKKAGYERIGAANIAEAVEQLIGIPETVLRSIQKDKDQPMCMRIVAEAILQPKGRFNALQTLLDRAHGKAKQQVDLSGEGVIPVPSVVVMVQAPKPDAGG